MSIISIWLVQLLAAHARGRDYEPGAWRGGIANLILHGWSFLKSMQNASRNFWNEPRKRKFIQFSPRILIITDRFVRNSHLKDINFISKVRKVCALVGAFLKRKEFDYHRDQIFSRETTDSLRTDPLFTKLPFCIFFAAMSAVELTN